MILDYLAQYYHSKITGQARSYLNSRGITNEAIRKFKIGFCSNNGYGAILRKGFTNKEIQASKMFSNSKEGSTYDYFYNRITIPISIQGTTVSFSSRLVGNDWKNTKMSSPHLHRRGKINISFNHDELLKKGTTYIIITEAPIDAMTLNIHKFKAIAILGANRLTRKTIEDLYGKQVYILFDYDLNWSGQRASKKIAQKLLNFDISSNIITLKSKKKCDANSYFQNGGTRESLIHELEESEKFIGEKETTKIRKIYSDKDIVQTIESYIEIEPSGSRFRALCPFHEDSQPSLVIYPQTGSYYCFSCNAGGNAEMFISRMKNV